MSITECVPSGTLSSPRSDSLGTVVKSAGRALQILEFFDHVHREACVSEISRALNYPQSSTSALLRSLVSMGYLLHDRFKRTYFPTRRVGLLGNWVDPAMLQQGALLVIADDLARETGLGVVMATANGLYAQCIYAHPASSDAGVAAEPVIGTLAPIAQTAVGRALLSTYDETHTTKLLRRINAERGEATPPLVVPEFLAELKSNRKRGIFAGSGAGVGQAGIAATLDRSRHPLVIALEGRSDEMELRENELAGILRTAVMRHSHGRHLLSA